VIDGKQFWLSDLIWDIPTYENAEVFVERLRRCGAIAWDSAVDAAISGDPEPLTRRSIQRHFVRVTGMTHSQFFQIERARRAVDLLKGGSSILDVVFDAGYFDQAHLTRSLNQLIGLTPARIVRNEAQLSFSYKTAAPE
jgi:methylphosphotriester-DNA--protein-cysteine methyltransferase